MWKVEITFKGGENRFKVLSFENYQKAQKTFNFWSFRAPRPISTVNLEKV